MKSLFSMLKKRLPLVENTAYYKNGVLIDILPKSKLSLYEDRHRAYECRFIASNNITYDMDDSASISCIAVPKYNAKNGFSNTSFDLAYNFQVRLKKEERPDIAVPLAFKTAQLMFSSPITWSKRDYYRVVIQLWTLGKINEADELLNIIKSKCPHVAAEDEYEYGRRQSYLYALKFAKEFKTDYIETTGGYCCPKCAPFSNRVYSISGKDARFPNLSKYLPVPEEYCCLGFNAFIYHKGCTIDTYHYSKAGNAKTVEVDAIYHSNRPFEDNRSLYLKSQDDAHIKMWEKKYKSDARYYNRQTWIDKYKKTIQAEEGTE